MAESVTTLSLWSDESVRVADVLAALEDLRRPEPMPPTRTSVLTLVIVASVAKGPSAVDEATAALHELGGRHPARVLTLLVDSADAQEPRIDAEVRLLGGEAEGHPLWFEDVRLWVAGPVVGHLDSLIEPFTLPDLPVVAWFVDGLPAIDDPLLRAADVVMVDARSFGDTRCFGELVALTRRLPVVDLSWQRLQPWRELLGGLFESAQTRPYVRVVRSARVVGRTGPRHLLGGWLADRLSLPSAEVHLDAAEHVSIELRADDARFAVERTDDGRVVRAVADLAGGPTAATVVPLPPNTPAWGLAEAFSRLGRDAVYERALRTAIALTDRH